MTLTQIIIVFIAIGVGLWLIGWPAFGDDSEKREPISSLYDLEE